MSENFTMHAGSDRPRDGFNIRTLGGCRIVVGAIPVSEMGMLTHGFSKDAMMATDIADRIGATLVIGEPADIDALRKMDLPVSAKREGDSLAAKTLGLPRIAEWLRTGERGASSNAMCKRIFGLPENAGTSHPLDPADLRRCLLFLDAAGAHERVYLMQDVSPEWARLVARWDDLAAMFAEESADGPTAPTTYALMREVLA